MTDLHDVAPPAPAPPRPPDGARRRTQLLLVLVAVLALLAGALAVALVLDDEGVAPATTPTTQPTTPTTAPPSSSPTTAPAGATATAVFPVGRAGFDDPVGAARAFALDLGFADPVTGSFQQGDSRSGEVELRPTADGPVTTVFVRQLTDDGTWYVLGSSTANIAVTEPEALAEVASPLRLRGTSTAFEANVGVRIRQDAEPFVVASSFVMGGSNGELGPFDGTVAFAVPSTPYGTLVLQTSSMADGSTWEASVLRIRFADAGAATRTVSVFFNGPGGPDSPLTAYERPVPSTPAVLRSALEQLLAGPTSEEVAAGSTSWFSPATADQLAQVRIDDAGNATVDFHDLRTVIPNASTSAGSRMLLEQLDATVFQFDSVTTVVYRIEGDCEAFAEWLQFGGCEPRRR